MDKVKVCKVDGCENKVTAKGLCRKHWLRQYRASVNKKCSVDGCTNKAITRNHDYCCKHNHQVERYGRILKRTKYDPNKILLKDDYALMFLYKKEKIVAETKIDKDTVSFVKKYKWHLDGHGYVATRIKNKIYRLHGLVLNNSDKNKVHDHISGNKLDNRKENLRLITQAQNVINKNIQSNNTSGRVGVSWFKSTKKWSSYIQVDGKKISLGYFYDFEDAVRARQDAELKYHGEYSPIENRKLTFNKE